MNFEQIKKSHIKHERRLAAVFVTAVVAILFCVWFVKNYDFGVVALVVGLLLIGAVSILSVRRIDVRITCEVCNFDLSDILHLVRKHDVLYCPKCGNRKT